MLSLADLVVRTGRRRLAVAANCSAVELAAVLNGLPADPPERLAAKAAEASAAIASAIADAVSEVSSAVAHRYDVAAVSAAPMLKRLAADRALFFLHADVVPEDLESRYKESSKLLEGLREGSHLVVDADGVPYPRLAGGGGACAEAPAPILTGPEGALRMY